MTDAWLQETANETYAYLTTVGRKSGKPHRIEIWFGVEGSRIFLMSGGRDRSDWVKNLIANPKVTIEIAGKTLVGLARVLAEDTLDDQLARALLVSKYQKNKELEKWGRESLAIVIDLEDAD